MKADIIVLGWNDYYAVNSDFDLNEVRKLVKVKEVKGKFLPEDEKTLEIKIGREIVVEEKEIEKVEISKLEDDNKNYSRWWTEEKEKVKKLEEELRCKKLELDEMRKEVRK